MDSDVAHRQINAFLLFGVLLLVVGGVVVAVGYPHTVAETYGSRDVGSAVALIIGAAVAGIGQILFLIGAVGRGVELGVHAARRPRGVEDGTGVEPRE